MASSGRARRIRRLVVSGAAAVLLGSAGTGVAQAGGNLLGLTPDRAKPGTPYKVTITCDQKPTLYGHQVDDNPPGTQVPLAIAPDGATQWTYNATAGDYDDQYGASCGASSEGARFDADSPHLFLSPIAENISETGQPRTEVLGTDCPTGSTASVTITLDGTTTTHTAAIDEHGDWTVPLATPYTGYGSKQSLHAEATCGDVTYAPLVREPQVIPPIATTPTGPTTATAAPATTPSAATAQPRRSQSSYTG